MLVCFCKLHNSKMFVYCLYEHKKFICFLCGICELATEYVFIKTDVGIQGMKDIETGVPWPVQIPGKTNPNRHRCYERL